VDLSTTFDVLDDLTSGYVISGGGTGVGPFGILTAVSGAGAIAQINVIPDTNCQGVYQYATGTTNSGYGCCFGSQGVGTFVCGGGVITFSGRIKTPSALSDGTDTYTIRGGIGSTSGLVSDPSNGIFIRYIHSANSGKWLYVCRAGGVESTADSGLAVATDTWYRYSAVVNAGGTSVTFTINGSNSGTVSSNVPTGTSAPMRIGTSIVKSAGTTSRSMYDDFYRVTQTFTTPR
jgi:hypothetical protein